MCSILIFAKPDNDHPDPDLDHTKFKRGMVVEVHENDDFFWGNDIHGKTALGWWRVVVVPGAKAADFAALAMGDHPLKEGPEHPRLRANILDLDAIEASHKPKDAAATIVTGRDVLMKARSTVVAALKKQPA